MVPHSLHSVPSTKKDSHNSAPTIDDCAIAQANRQGAKYTGIVMRISDVTGPLADVVTIVWMIYQIGQARGWWD